MVVTGLKLLSWIGRRYHSSDGVLGPTEELGAPLERYLADSLPDKVSLHRLPERQGLIKGRHRGAQLARGEVLIFLDSHVEPCDKWSVLMLGLAARSWRREKEEGGGGGGRGGLVGSGHPTCDSLSGEVFVIEDRVQTA